MQRKRKYILAAACAAAMAALTTAFTPVNALFDKGETPGVSGFTKTEAPGVVMTFSKEDFQQDAGDISGIIISSLPDQAAGRLVYSGREVERGSVLPASSLGALSFVPGSSDEFVGAFDFTPIFTDTGASDETATVSINMTAAENIAPIAQNASYETYCDMPLTASLKAVDPDGDDCRFTLTRKPQFGTVAVDNGSFTYTPTTGRERQDSFGFTVCDRWGAESAEATVTIDLIKRDNSEALRYNDMADSTAHYAAVKLAEAGVLRGESIGTGSFLYPDREVSRAQFVSMISKLYSMPLPTAAVVTGMGDNDEIPTWAQPCVAAALSCNIVTGEVQTGGNKVFRATDPITKAEAAVVINRILSLPDDGRTPEYTDADSVPSWAAQAVLNAVSNGYIALEDDGSFSPYKPMTREASASTLYTLMEALESKDKGFFDIFK